IETTGAFDAVTVYGEPETASLARDVIEKKILKRFVTACGRLAASNESSIDRACSEFIRIVKVELAQVSRFELNRQRAISFLAFERGGDNSLQVSSQRRWERAKFQIG